jgi:hypothetical protein
VLPPQRDASREHYCRIDPFCYKAGDGAGHDKPGKLRPLDPTSGGEVLPDEELILVLWMSQSGDPGFGGLLVRKIGR